MHTRKGNRSRSWGGVRRRGARSKRPDRPEKKKGALARQGHPGKKKKKISLAKKKKGKRPEHPRLSLPPCGKKRAGSQGRGSPVKKEKAGPLWEKRRTLNQSKGRRGDLGYEKRKKGNCATGRGRAGDLGKKKRGKVHPTGCRKKEGFLLSRH